jgi:hypothetical protein
MKQNQKVAIALLALFVLWCGWQSKFSPRPPQSPEHKEGAAQTTKESSNNDPFKLFWSWTTKDSVSFYTFILAIFTGILGATAIVQIRYLRLSNETASTAAEAAKRSADAAIAIELPVIRIKVDGFGFGVSQEGEHPRIHYCSIHFVNFRNLGRTKDFPIELQLGLFFGAKLPDRPSYRFRKSFPITAIYEPDAEVEREFRIGEFIFETPADMYDRLRNKTECLWFFCSFSYLDFMQNRHDVGFCWERHESFGAGVLIADPTPAYNQKT